VFKGTGVRMGVYPAPHTGYALASEGFSKVSGASLIRRNMRASRILGLVAATAVVTALAAPLPAQAATVFVSSVSELNTAAGSGATNVIVLTQDITASAQVNIGFPTSSTATIDLNTFDLTVSNVVVHGLSNLTLTDSSLTPGTLTATSPSAGFAGITLPNYNPNLVIDGSVNVVVAGSTGQPGIGPKGAGVSIGDSAVVSAVGGAGAAGIGGDTGNAGIPVTISGDATVTATGGDGGAGIGGGDGGDSTLPIAISGAASVTTDGGGGAAGIGGGRNGSATAAITIDGASTVTASGGLGAAGIGAGDYVTQGGSFVSIDIGGSAVVAAIGGGAGGPALGAAAGGSVGSVDLDDTSTTTVSTPDLAISAINALYPVTGTGTLVVPVGEQLLAGITSTNTLDVVMDGTWSSNPGIGIDNQGVIRGSGTVTPAVLGRNYLLSYDYAGGVVSDTSIVVRAGSLAAAHESLPATTRAGFVFDGWRTASDAPMTDTTLGAPSTGAPSPIAVHAAWTPKVATTTTVTSTPSSALTTDAVILTATVSSGTGTVAFTVDGAAVGTVPLTGATASVALSPLTAGTHAITASYSGDATNLASSGSASLTVTAPVVTTVAKTVVAAKVSGKRFAKNTKPKVTVTFTKGGKRIAVSGKVAIYVGKKKVKTVTLKTKSTTTVTLPKKYSKAIKVKAKFLGSTTIAPATSKTLKLKVK
jgi:uncharacterized repeat protein (TIGR02543 family)